MFLPQLLFYMATKHGNEMIITNMRFCVNFNISYVCISSLIRTFRRSFFSACIFIKMNFNKDTKTSLAAN